MFRVAILATALGVAAFPAAAQRNGTYAVEGTDPRGGSYAGTATLTQLDDKSWQVVWQIAGSSARGIGLVTGGALVVGYISSGAPGIAVYNPQPDGSMSGPWTAGQGTGTERMVPR